MSANLRVYFSFRSPYARLGLHRINRFEHLTKATLTLIPFTGPAGGAPFLDPMSSAPKMAYYAEDAPRETKRMGLRMRLPNPFEVNFMTANKAFISAQQAGSGLAFALAVSDARWSRGKDVSSFEILEKCAEEVGLSSDLVTSAQEDTDITDQIDEFKAQCDKDMAFGVPFAVLETPAQTHKFWGQDRFAQIDELLAEL